MRSALISPISQKTPAPARSAWRRARTVVAAGSVGLLAALSACSTGGNADPNADTKVDATADGAPLPAEVTVNLTGDLLWHPAVYESGMMPDGSYDYSQTFAGVRPEVKAADLAICHEEVPFAPYEGPFSGYPSFAAPPQIAAQVKETGWDMCTTASNHSIDAGTEGLVHTLNVMDEAGIVHAGSARSQEEFDAPRMFETAEGVKIAVVAGTYGLNGLIPEFDYLVPDLDPDTLLKRARDAREAGADIVMVAMHAGDEGVTEPTAQQQELAELLTQSDDVDIVYGHHAHAVQPIEKVNGKWVIYGLGNLVAQQLSTNIPAFEGLMVDVTFVPKEGANSATEGPAWEVGTVTFTPTVISPPGIHPVTATPISRAIENTRAEFGEDADVSGLEAARERTLAAVYSRGAEGEADLVEG